MPAISCRKTIIAGLLISTCFSGAAFAQATTSISSGDPADPATWRTAEFNRQYWLGFIGADYAYAMGADGSGVKVGVIDTGFAVNHPEFIGRYEEGVTVLPDKPWYIDVNSGTHGSAVAGVIAANRDGQGMHGVAPGATIVPVNVDIGGGQVDLNATVAGIYGLVARDVHIINNSYGMANDITRYPPEFIFEQFGTAITAFEYAVDNDTLLIWATGNDGVSQPHIQASMPYLVPELERGWLAVTGYDYEYANQCGVAKNWCLTAPAYDVVSVQGNGGYQLVNGTSFAAPHVAGVAALVKQMFPYMTMDQVRQVLLGTAHDIGAVGVDEIYGYGVLNASAAVLGPGKFDWGNFHAKINDSESLWFNNITGAGGLVKSGTGILTLFGDSTYTGKTVVNDGILALAGSLTSDLSVTQHGTFAGRGTVYGNIDNSGTIYGGWGGQGGALTIAGDYHQAAAAVMEVKVGAVNGTSRVDISGAADLEGGTVSASLVAGGYRGDTRHTILTSGALTGTFDNIAEDYAFLDFGLGYDGGNAYLDVSRNDLAFADIGTSHNQRSVAAGIESLADTAATRALPTAAALDIYDLIIESNTQQARNAYDLLSGEIHSGLKSALLDESRFVRQAIAGRFREMKAQPASTLSPVIWGQAYGSWGHLAGAADTAKTTHRSGGIYAGIEGEPDDAWQAGFAAGYGKTTLESDARLSSATADNYTLAAYAGRQFDRLALRFGAAHTWHSISTTRITPLATASADYNSGATQVFSELNYAQNYNEVTFEPFANLSYVNLRTGSIDENGAAGLISQTGHNDNIFSVLGLRAQTHHEVSADMQLTLRGMAGWQHGFGDVSPDTRLAFTASKGVDVAGFSIEGAGFSRDAFVAEAGFALTMARQLSVGLSYNGQISSAVKAHGIRGDLSWKF